MSAFYQSPGLFKYHVRYLHMSFGRLVECGSDHLGLHAAAHVRNLLRALVNQEHNLVNLRVIVRDGIGYGLEQHSLTRLRLGHDKTPLSLSDRSEHIHDTAGKIALVTLSEEIELLIREERSQEIERNPVPDEFRRPSVDIGNLYEREVFVTLLRRPDFACHGIAVLQRIVLYLAL